MTLETKTFLCPTDIVAIHYKCSECGSDLAVPVGKEHSVPDFCPTCRARWFPGPGDQRQNEIYGLLELIRAVQARVKGNEYPIRVMVEVNCSTK